MWYFIRDGLNVDGEQHGASGESVRDGGNKKGPYRSEIVISVMPIDFACSYIRPSTSLDTALVHSTKGRYNQMQSTI